MSTREALIEDLMKQPESIVRKMRRYLDEIIGPKKHDANGVVHPQSNAWPANYFDQTAGAFASERFERPAHLPFEKRGDW